MKKLLRILLIATLSATLFSCEKNEPTPIGNYEFDKDNYAKDGTEDDARLYMPLAVGNQWIYITTYYDENGNEYLGSNPDFQVSFDTVRVINKMMFEGKEAYELYASDNMEGEPNTIVAYEGQDLVFWIDAGEMDEEEEVPIKIEAGWYTYLGQNGTKEQIVLTDTTYTMTEGNQEFEVNLNFDFHILFEDNGIYTFGNISENSRKATMNVDATFTVFFTSYTESESQEIIYLKGVGVVESDLSTEEDDNGNQYFGRQRLLEYNLVTDPISVRPIK